MTSTEKNKKLASFNNEKEFREFLIDFLKKSGFHDVLHTHRYGSPEQGKDIIGRIDHPITGNDWFAFVVKKGRISGGTNEIETIKNQILQSFEYPYKGINGEQININKVTVVTNENFTNGAQSQITESPKLKLYNNFTFWWNETLVPAIDKNYPDFWLPGDAFAKEFSKNFSHLLQEEISIRELSIRKVDDKKIQKLLDIFIEPIITTDYIEENKVTKVKKNRTTKVNLNNINKIVENILISGDQGSGKTKILNSLAKKFSSPELIFKNKELPVKLKATDLRDSNFDLDELIVQFIKKFSDQFYEENFYKEYKVLLFIDDFDLLNKTDKDKILEVLQNFCKENDTHFIITYQKSDLNYDESITTYKIHNFNLKQIETFVLKFFEGSDRAEKFIRILRDSDILSKLPTTPLTISLLSLLYDENNFEIPATLSDIYDDFTNVLLGKLEIYNRSELLIYNIKKRIFTSLALKMMDDREFEIQLQEFIEFVNQFLYERGYQKQSSDEIKEIIEKSGLLYITDKEEIGFKQQAFVEFLSSIEIYHHKRETHYIKLIENFNDVTWQNTAIFYAGHSKELEGMIDDVIEKSPNNNLRDWFINSSGMGYLAQALYQSKPIERQKLIIKALDNLLLAYHKAKELTGDEKTVFYNMPLPLLAASINYWFNENFKSITLKQTLEISFDEIFIRNNDFENNYRLLMIATTLHTPYINEENKFIELIERNEFMDHPILPLVADFAIEIGMIQKKDVNPELKEKIEKQIKKKRDYIRAVLKEPAYRFNESFALEAKK
ncbi:NACHT domain-containing NTPase [Arenibacter sp. ARW7G5Y1]|uniref:NACHT domain-containing protein n=1 Tax=Arenibacter sp. ARW7G5Y1 TaxID=2135619 RepID=UPI000D767933|nr:NACHT domain-containing protein [Arenibacter sp. ARW7G5Y1]PXX30645.1 restriction endonuclease [Arenibacter sp. ARW7G5Y1]